MRADRRVDPVEPFDPRERRGIVGQSFQPFAIEATPRQERRSLHTLGLKRCFERRRVAAYRIGEPPQDIPIREERALLPDQCVVKRGATRQC